MILVTGPTRSGKSTTATEHARHRRPPLIHLADANAIYERRQVGAQRVGWEAGERFHPRLGEEDGFARGAHLRAGGEALARGGEQRRHGHDQERHHGRGDELGILSLTLCFRNQKDSVDLSDLRAGG
jgi:hypothetical protein